MTETNITCETLVEQESWTTMGNATICDTKLSYRALGVLTYMLSKVGNWKFYICEIAKKMDDAESNREGRDAIRKTIQMLAKYKYVVRKRQFDNKGKFVGVKYFVGRKPITTIKDDFPEKVRVTENPLTDNRVTENPRTENPRTEKPRTENPTLLSNNITKSLNSLSPKTTTTTETEEPQISEPSQSLESGGSNDSLKFSFQKSYDFSDNKFIAGVEEYYDRFDIQKAIQAAIHITRTAESEKTIRGDIKRYLKGILKNFYMTDQYMKSVQPQELHTVVDQGPALDTEKIIADLKQSFEIQLEGKKDQLEQEKDYDTLLPGWLKSLKFTPHLLKKVEGKTQEENRKAYRSYLAVTFLSEQDKDFFKFASIQGHEIGLDTYQNYRYIGTVG